MKLTGKQVVNASIAVVVSTRSPHPGIRRYRFGVIEIVEFVEFEVAGPNAQFCMVGRKSIKTNNSPRWRKAVSACFFL